MATTSDAREAGGEELVARLAWVRALARELVRDEASADDLAQETVVAALERGPDEPGALAAWLRGVVRRLAALARRGEVRRARREKKSAPPEEQPATVDVVARLALFRRVVDAVESLSEPSRSAILLRFYDGLPPRAIAARLGVPVKTVKTRVARGLEQLRARLVADLARERGDHTLAHSLAPLLLAGVSAVSSKVKLALAAAAVVALFAAVDPLGWRRRPSEPKRPLAAEAPREVVPQPPPGAQANTPERTEVAAKTPTKSAASLASFRSLLRGKVVEDQKRPVAGARVELLRHADARDASAPDDPLDATTSDEGGEFEFNVAPHRAFDLSARSTAGARAFALEKYSGEWVDLRVAATSTLRGRVTSKADGAPVEDALVRILLGGGPLGRSSTSLRTDHDGRFVATDLEGDTAAVSISSALGVAPAFFPQSDEQVALRRGGEVIHDFVVAVAAVLHGHVLDARTRAPIAGAELSILAPNNVAFSARSDADGSWRAPTAATHCVYRIAARARGYGTATLQVTVLANDVEQDVVLAPGRRARGRILGPDGAPLAGAVVRATANVPATHGNQTDSIATSSAPDGRFELGDLRRELTHFLVVAHEGLGTILRLFPEEESAGDEIELGDLALQRGSVLFGKVTWQGDACAGVSVRLRGLDSEWRGLRPDAPDDLRELAGVTDWREPPIDRRGATCDSNGLYHFADLAPGVYEVESGERLGAKASATVEIARSEVTVKQDLVLRPTGSIEGIVVDRSDRPVERRQIHVISDSGARSQDAFYPDANGRFRVEGIVTSLCSLEVDSLDFPFFQDARPNLSPRNFVQRVVHDVATGTRDLRIVLDEGRRLAIRVLERDGSRALHVQLRVVVPDLEPSLTTTWAMAEFVNSPSDVTPLLVPAGVAVTVEARRARVEPNGRALWPLASQPPDFVRAGVYPEDGELTIVLPPAKK
jgi:RNA polymerase sigma factor (sigma-70 family)